MPKKFFFDLELKVFFIGKKVVFFDGLSREKRNKSRQTLFLSCF